MLICLTVQLRDSVCKNLPKDEVWFRICKWKWASVINFEIVDNTKLFQQGILLRANVQKCAQKSA